MPNTIHRYAAGPNIIPIIAPKIGPSPIFIYYLMATMFPVDKLIGNIYPLFAVVLLFMAVALKSIVMTR